MSRKGSALVAVCALSCAWFSEPAAGQLRFTQDFERLKPGTDGSPALIPLDAGWSVEDGRYVQRAAEGRFDLAALFPNYLRGRYVLRVKLSHRSPFHGGGLCFNLSSTKRLEFGQMVRFDGAQELLYGSFRDGAFEPDGRLLVVQPIEGERWIELALSVDEKRGVYAVHVDGEEIARDLPLRYPSGYAGLQVSNGSVAFDDVYAEIQSDFDRAVRWPGRFALCSRGFAFVEPVHGRLVACDAGADGDLELHSLANEARAARSLASRRRGGFALLESAPPRVRVFDEKGHEERSFSFAGTQVPVDLDADASDRLHVLASDGTVLVLDGKGETVASGTLAPDRRGASELSAIAVRGDGRGLVLDVTQQRAIETRIDGAQVLFGAEHALPFDVRDLAFARAEAADEAIVFLACAGRVEARRLNDASGLGPVFERTSEDGSLRLDPVAIDVAPEGWIAVADRANQRILRLPPELAAAEPKWSFEAPGLWHATWVTARTGIEVDAALQCSDGKGGWADAKLDHTHAGREQHLRAAKLPTAREVRFLVRSGGVDSVPAPRSAPSVALRTPPPAGEHHCVKLRALALVYSDVRHPAPDSAALPERVSLSAELRTRWEAELEEGALFYWLNSGFHFWLDLDVRFVDDALEAGAIHADGEAEGEPLRREIETRSEGLRLDLDEYAAVLVVSARRAYDVATGTWRLQGHGGGLTIGPESRGYGLSWWSAPSFCGAEEWLLVHEFHHQLDAMFAAVGHPEYWFNHFSPTLGTAARFGEHHDGNAYLLRHWPDWKWWSLLDRPALASRKRAFASLAVLVDADSDGFPDADPRLPLDEQRFGSSSESADTDADGLGDRAEAMLEIKSGLGGAGWTQAVFAARPAPRLADADGDRKKDGEDEQPLYRVETEIPLAEALVDGAFAEGEARPLLQVGDPAFALELAASHKDGALHCIARLDRPGRIEILLDGNDDGWFVGRENYRVRLEGEGDAPRVELVVQDAATPGRWPFETDALVPSSTLNWKATRDASGATLFELRLPASSATGFRAAPGRSFGLAVGVETRDSRLEERGILSVFEPHRLVRFRCAP